MNFKVFCKNKASGFRVAVFVSALAVITFALYLALFLNTSEFNVAACALIAACGASAGLLFNKNICAFAPYIQFILALSAFMFYVYGVYYYVSVVLVGIDLDSFSAQFIICSALFALTTIASAVSVFLKQTKTDAKEQTE